MSPDEEKQQNKKARKKQTKKKRTVLRSAAKPRTRKKAVRKQVAPAVEAAPEAIAPPPPPPPAGPYINRGGDLPAAFGDDRIHALVRDPEWVFVYWELHGDRSNNLVRTHGGGRGFTEVPWHLRVYGVEGLLEQEIPVFVGASNWYVRTGRGNKVVIEIGFYAYDGNFHVAAASDVISTPRGTPSGDRRETWMRRAPGQQLAPGTQGYTLVPGEPPEGAAIDIPGAPDGPFALGPGGGPPGSWSSTRLVRARPKRDKK